MVKRYSHMNFGKNVKRPRTVCFRENVRNVESDGAHIRTALLGILVGAAFSWTSFIFCGESVFRNAFSQKSAQEASAISQSREAGTFSEETLNSELKKMAEAMAKKEQESEERREKEKLEAFAGAAALLASAAENPDAAKAALSALSNKDAFSAFLSETVRRFDNGDSFPEAVSGGILHAAKTPTVPQSGGQNIEEANRGRPVEATPPK